jgi:hypothetical protein
VNVASIPILVSVPANAGAFLYGGMLATRKNEALYGILDDVSPGPSEEAVPPGR